MWNTCYCCYDLYYSFFYYSCCYCHHRYYYKYVCIFLGVLFLFAINSTKDYQKILLQKVKFFTFIAIKQHCLDIVLLLLLFIVAELCPTLWDSMDCSLPASSVHGIFPGKNTGVGIHFLLQEIFLTQGSNLSLLLGRWILYHWATFPLKGESQEKILVLFLALG